MYSAIHRLWTDPSYRQNAQPLPQAIATACGVARVADIMEQAISTGQRLL